MNGLAAAPLVVRLKEEEVHDALIWVEEDNAAT
jgi:hypothetical protein